MVYITFVNYLIICLKIEYKFKDILMLKSRQMASRLNESFADIMKQMYDIRTRGGEPFRAKIYKQTYDAIMKCNINITCVDDLKAIGIKSEKIFDKFQEFQETGCLSELEKENNNPINEFTKIHGIGPKKAKQLIDMKITTIEKLKEESFKFVQLLTDAQKVGLKHFDDCNIRIERSEIDLYNKLFTKYFNPSLGSGETPKVYFCILKPGSNTHLKLFI